MIHPTADPTEIAADLRAERAWNAATTEDLALILTENLRLAQECADLRLEVMEHRRAELVRMQSSFLRPMGVAGMVA